jgi:type IV pilus assembly protein PilN
MRPLNLATRPFRNEALPSLAFWAAVLLLVALTGKQALVIRALLPDKTSALHEEVKALDSEAARLRAEAVGLRGPAPDVALLTRWSQLKDLVDQRTFSWTRLMVRLEKVIPEGVRISAITPTVRQGDVRLDLSAQAQSTEAGLEMLKRLQQRPEFKGAIPVSVGESGAEGASVKEFKYAMLYDPSSAPAEEAPAPKDEAAADASGGEGEDAKP